MKFTLLPKVGLLVIALSLFMEKSHAQLSTYFSSVQTGVTLDPGPFTSNLISTAVDNGVSGVTALPFTVNFAGTNYTQFTVSSNGLMRLGGTAITSDATNSLAGGTNDPKLAVYWDDLAVSSSGGIGFITTGVSPNRKMIVQFRLNTPKAGTTVSTMQIWIYETSNIIQFVYGTIPSNTTGASVGLSTSNTAYISCSPNGSTSTFSSSTVNNNITAAITSGLSLTFAPVTCATSYFPANNATGINGVTGTTLSWSSGGAGTSYDVYFGTSATPPLVSTGQTATTYATGVLADSTTYYWRIATKNGTSVLTSCVTNQFTTSSLLNYKIDRTTGITYSSISATGTSISSWKNSTNTDDNISNKVSIGFNFRYAGAIYTSFQVGVNGFILFDSTNAFTGGGSTNPYNYDANSFFSTGTNASPLMLAGFYQDLMCQGNPGTLASLQNSIKYSVSGTSPNRVLTVEWIYMQPTGLPGPNLNFQIKLYETSNIIEYIYGTMEEFNGSSNALRYYNIGLTGRNISNPTRQKEILGMLTENTNNFGLVTASLAKAYPECNTRITFTPGNYIQPVITAVVPANDNPATAISIATNGSPCTSFCGSYYSSANATSSGISTALGTSDDDVWFRFVAPAASTTVRVYASGGYTPSLEIWNSNATTRITNAAGSSGLTATSNLTGLTVGTTYLIRVFDFNVGFGNSGRFALCVWNTQPAPSNDNCSGAVSMPVTASVSLVAGVSNLTATASPSIPICSVSGTTPDDDVWYSFNADNTTEVITVQGNNGFDPVLQVFSGGCASLTALQCVNALGSSQAETITLTNLTRNQVYYFRIYHSAGGAGTGSYSLNVSSPIPVCPTTLLPASGTSNVPLTGLTLRWNRVPNANSYRVLIDSLNNPPQALYAVTTDTFYVKPSVDAGFDYFWSIQPLNTSGYLTSCQTNYFSAIPLYYALNIRVFLEGFYIGNNTMNRSINPADTIADSITVSLMNPTTRAEMYSSTARLSINGLASPTFPQPAVGLTYYIRVKHRNSLETWSGTTFAFNDADTTYNFTDAPTKAFGSNMTQVSTGVWAIYGGDVNQDGTINFSDFQMVDAVMNQFYSGYIREDVNGDRLVESADYSFIENKLAILRSVIRP